MSLKKLDNRKRNLIAIGVKSALSLRLAARDHGVPGVGDFLNGLMMAGLTLELTVEGDADFVEVFESAIDSVDDILVNPHYREAKEGLGDHILGVIEGDRFVQSSTVAWAAEGTLVQLAKDFEMSKTDLLQVASYAVIGTICSATSPDMREDLLRVSLHSLKERKRGAAEVASMTMGDLFSD